MVRPLPAAVALLIALAGCATAPGNGSSTPAGHRVSVSVTNEQDASYAVRVTVLPAAVDGLAVTYANGSTRSFDVASLDALPPTALRNATAVSTAGDREVTRSVVVGPSEGFGTTIEETPADARVVYFVRRADDPGAGRGAGVVRCSADATVTDLSIRIRPNGALHAAVTCHDDPAAG